MSESVSAVSSSVWLATEVRAASDNATGLLLNDVGDLAERLCTGLHHLTRRRILPYQPWRLSLYQILRMVVHLQHRPNINI